MTGLPGVLPSVTQFLVAFMSPVNGSNPNLAAARRLAAAGLAVFPCKLDKKPLVKWREQSTTDQETIHYWWTVWPSALPAIDLAKCGLIVVDLDKHVNGPDGERHFRALADEHNDPLNQVPVISTANLGFHLYYLQPDGKSLGNGEGTLRGKGINIRGVGGYVMGPGAMLHDESGWEQILGTPDLLEAFVTGTIPVMPAWLQQAVDTGSAPISLAGPLEAGSVDASRDRSYALAALEEEAQRVAAAAEGTRNNTLNEAAFKLGTLIPTGGIDRQEVEATLKQAALHAGLEPRETARTMESGIDSGMAHPRQGMNERDAVLRSAVSFVGALSASGPSIGSSQQPTATGVPSRTAISSETSKDAPEIINAAELMQRQFPPVRYVLPGYLPEGLALLAGKPKTGKSWLALDWALAVAMGGYAFGSVACDQGDVLYLALEDNERRLQRRLKQMLPYGAVPDRLKVAVSWPRLDAGGLDLIQEWAASVPDPRLVAIDTLALARPAASSKHQTMYRADYDAISPLQQLAGALGIAIVLVHHQRKMAADDPFDTVSGTLGLSGAVDTILVLDRSTQGVVLYGRGRDIEEFERAVRFDPTQCRWTVMGEATEVHRSRERQAILDALKSNGEPMKPKEIADALGVSSNNIKQLVRKMAKIGEVTKTGPGRYTHSDNPDNPITRCEAATQVEVTELSELPVVHERQPGGPVAFEPQIHGEPGDLFGAANNGEAYSVPGIDMERLRLASEDEDTP